MPVNQVTAAELQTHVKMVLVHWFKCFKFIGCCQVQSGTTKLGRLLANGSFQDFKGRSLEQILALSLVKIVSLFGAVILASAVLLVSSVLCHPLCQPGEKTLLSRLG